MNIIPLLTFYLINSQVQFADREIKYEIAQSLIYVIEKFFVPRSSSFVFILSCERQQTLNFYKDLAEVLFNYWGDIKTEIIVNSETSNPAHSGERIYNLLLVDSSESFLKIKLASKVEKYDINEYYHIFLQNKDQYLADDIQQILNYCWQNQIINVNVQVQKSSGEIIVYTYFPFSKSYCGKVIPTEINRYRNGTWINKVLFPQKLLDMHNCPLKVATWEFSPYITLDFNKTGRASIGGYEGQLLKQLSRLMNFEIDIIANGEKRGVLEGNKSTGAFGMLLRRDIEFSFGCFWFTASRTELFTASESYLQASSVPLLLASSANNSKAITLWFPFEGSASVALLVAFLISFALLRILTKLLKKWSWSTTYPTINRNITLDFIACTLGLPSSLDARWNSGRIFIMAWMLFGLVIRTVFGATIYHLIRNNLLRKPPSTISDVMKLNYSMALNPPAISVLRQTSIFTDTGLGIVVVDGEYPTSVFEYLEEHSNERLLTIAPLNLALYYIAKYRKVDVLTTLQDSFLQQSSCIYFPKHSYLTDQINFFIQRIKSAGLLECWLKKAIDSAYLFAKRTPPVFTIGQQELEGIYYICGMMLGISFLVFCLEILSLKFELLKKLFQKL